MPHHIYPRTIITESTLTVCLCIRSSLRPNNHLLDGTNLCVQDHRIRLTTGTRWATPRVAVVVTTTIRFLWKTGSLLRWTLCRHWTRACLLPAVNGWRIWQWAQCSWTSGWRSCRQCPRNRWCRCCRTHHQTVVQCLGTGQGSNKCRRGRLRDWGGARRWIGEDTKWNQHNTIIDKGRVYYSLCLFIIILSFKGTVIERNFVISVQHWVSTIQGSYTEESTFYLVGVGNLKIYSFIFEIERNLSLFTKSLNIYICRYS